LFFQLSRPGDYLKDTLTVHLVTVIGGCETLPGMVVGVLINVQCIGRCCTSVQREIVV